MATLTIFANFCIDDEERFLRMKDSFRSIENIEAQKWVVNVRGKYKNNTLSFLHENLGDKLISYSLESKQGWFHDTRQMLAAINTNYVFFWVEDHINLIDVSTYIKILNEMKDNNTEYMCYSWWLFGKLREPYQAIEKTELEHISTFVFDRAARKKMNPRRTYIISMTGFFSVDLFKRIVNADVFFRTLPKLTPFNFEKTQCDTKWLPINYAIPKYELFASIDDNHGEAGYSLQARELYPLRVQRTKDMWKKERKINPDTTLKLFYRAHVKKYVPHNIHTIKNQIGKFARRFKSYIYLTMRGM